MTVQSTAVQTTAVANGLATTFTYQFKLQEATDLVVQVQDLSAPPALHTLTLNSDYTVDPLGLNLDAGGNILNCTYLGATIPNGWTVFMTREMALTQDTDLANQGTYLPESVESEFDAIVMMEQGHDFQLARTIHVLLTDPAIPPLPPASQRLGMYLQFDPSTGQPNPVPGAPSVLKDNFTASAPPTTANDNTQGYSEGSRWFDTIHNTVYICMSAATGAAVWVQLVVKNNLTAVVAPTTANDNTQGYSVNSVWLNTANNNFFICLSAATGAALWSLIYTPTPAGQVVNYFIDPCCRVAQIGYLTNIALSTSRTYGTVDLIQCWGSGTAITSGSITQDNPVQATNTGIPVIGIAKYSCLIEQVTITGTGKVFFRKWIESRDAVALNGKTVMFSVLGWQNTGAAINAFLTLNKFNAQDNSSAVTLLATGSTVSLPNTTETPITMAYTFGASDGTNGIELILEMDCGAVTTKGFQATDWQACIGAAPAVCVVPDFVFDFHAAQRYYEQSYVYGTKSGTVTNNGMTVIGAPGGWGSGTTYGELFQAKYRVAKVIAPAVTVYSPNNGASGNAYAFIAAANKAMTATSDTSMFYLTAGVNVADSDALQFHWVADARL